MRLPNTTPLLLLLAAPTLLDALEIYNQAQPNLQKRDLVETQPPTNFAPESSPETPVSAAAANKPRDSSTPRYRVTENAPVDGFDGKPHLGPFVDRDRDDDASATQGATKTTSLAPKARPTDLDKWTQAGSHEWRLEEIPEKNDGVMNDENRVGPKKGTDGTAGGITERERKAAAAAAKGEGNKPQEPKEAPPLPHSEEEFIVKQTGEDGERSGTRVPDATKKDEIKYGAGGYGIDLPEGLPEKVHRERSGGEPPVSGAAKEKWLVDTMPYTEGQRPASAPKPKVDNQGQPAPAVIPSEGDGASWHEWVHSFVLSLTMILVSEIGDKTFLVAALMAMRHPRVLVFSSAFAALVVMTALSAVLGHAFPAFLPKRLTTFAAAVLFLVFGARSLREGLAMSPDLGVGEEMKEVEAELEEKEHSLARQRSSSAGDYTLESGRGRPEPSPPSSRSPSPGRRRRNGAAGLMNLLGLVLSPAWVQTFVMTFLGEWGDRSQIATIAMAAGQDYWWVTLGAVTGHACCTGIAVVGGRALAGRVSMRVVTIGGAVAFLVFGVIYLFECITEKA